MSFKSDFPILKNKVREYPITYLDSAASTQKPQEVINSISEFYQNSYENVHRGMNSLSIDATDLYEKSRDVAKNFINSKSLLFSKYSKGLVIKSNDAIDVNTIADWKKLKLMYKKKNRNAEI